MNENVRVCMCVCIYIYQFLIFNFIIPKVGSSVSIVIRGNLVNGARYISPICVANSSIGFALYSVENFLIVLLRGEKVVCDRDRRW